MRGNVVLLNFLKLNYSLEPQTINQISLKKNILLENVLNSNHKQKIIGFTNSGLSRIKISFRNFILRNFSIRGYYLPEQSEGLLCPRQLQVQHLTEPTGSSPFSRLTSSWVAAWLTVSVPLSEILGSVTAGTHPRTHQ